MRRFIYLDTDVLNSYIAQIDDGLLDSHEVESQLGDVATKQIQHTVDTEIGADLKFFGKGLEGKVNYIFERMKSSEQSESFKDVRTKKLHDNAFDRFIGYLESNNQLSNSACSIGSFIKFSDELSFIDLDYLLAQFNKNGLIEFIKASQADRLEGDFKLSLNREEQRTVKKEDIKKAVADNNRQYDDLFKVLEMMKLLIPYKNIVASGDYLIATSEKYFRENNPEVISFKYGGDLTIVGYITNTVYSENDSPSKSSISPLTSIQPMINKMITTLFNSEKTMHIIHPIAIYYE